MFLRRFVPLIMLVCLAVPALAQNSNRGTAEVTINGKKVTIDYGRPSLAGRDMLSQAKVGQVWRLGMNKATEIETTGSLVVGKTTLKPGRYSLWARKTGANTWVLAFHPKTGVWGAPALESGYVAELPLKLTTAAQPAEMLTISLADQNGSAGITIQWGTTALTGTFGVQ